MHSINNDVYYAYSQYAYYFYYVILLEQSIHTTSSTTTSIVLCIVNFLVREGAQGIPSTWPRRSPPPHPEKPGGCVWAKEAESRRPITHHHTSIYSRVVCILRVEEEELLHEFMYVLRILSSSHTMHTTNVCSTSISKYAYKLGGQYYARKQYAYSRVCIVRARSSCTSTNVVLLQPTNAY